MEAVVERRKDIRINNYEQAYLAVTLCKKIFPELFYVKSTATTLVERRARIIKPGPAFMGAANAGVKIEDQSLRLISDHCNMDNK
jgi:hypothetical protein